MRLPVIVGLSVWMATAAAQERQISPTTPDLVQIDVLATDQADRPVRDLTVDDFEIVEDGRRQKIANFRFVHVPPGTRDVAEARRFAIVIDDRHIALDTSKLARIKEMLGRFLKDLSPADEAAVVYTNRSAMSQDYTNDLAAQLRALDRFKAALDQRAPDPRAGPRDYRASATVLRNVVRVLGGSPQARRTVLFIAEATFQVLHGDQYLPSEEDAGEFVDLLKLARQANVPVYTIDPRSMVTAYGIPEWTEWERMTQVGLRQLASKTGGRAFVDRSKMASAVEEILTDNGSFYVLRFTPDPLVRDGKFHSIEVRVKRPGVRVRSRTGYVAAGPGS